MNSLFRIVAWVFHPVWVNVYLIIMILNTNHFITDRFFPYQRLVLSAIFFFSMALLPLAVLWKLSRKEADKVDFAHLSESMRNKSLILMVLLIALHGIVFSKVRDLDFLSVYFQSALITWLLILFFHQFFRISFHAAAAGMIPAVLWFLWPNVAGLFWPVLVLGAILSVLIPFSRYQTRDHQPQELISGCLIGFCATSLIFAMNYGL